MIQPNAMLNSAKFAFPSLTCSDSVSLFSSLKSRKPNSISGFFVSSWYMNSSKPFSLIVLLALSFFAGACTEEPSVQKYKVSKTPVPGSDLVTATQSLAGEVVDSGLNFTWTVPAGWEPGKSSSMRLASYNVPLSNGETGDFSLIKLGGDGGGIIANLNRWRGQVGLDPVTIEQVAEFSHMHSTSQGKQFLHATLINAASPGSAILAAIFQESDYVLFAKLSASAAGAQEANSSFEAFCNSITFTDE